MKRENNNIETDERLENKRELHPMILVWCVVIMVLCAIGLLIYFLKGWNAEKEMDDLRFTYVTAEPIDKEGQGETGGENAGNGTNTQNGSSDTNTQGSDSGSVEGTEAPVYTTIDGVSYPDFTGLDMPDREVDFKGLQSDVNEDIYAWIYIPNTKVDYPILQHPTSDEYYLDHDMNKKQVTAGSIFTQHYNDKDFNDNHTVIYGHNMKNGSMFKTLHYYMEGDFFEKNPYVYLYLDGETRVYQIFGAYEYGDAHLLLNYNMEDEAVFGEYLEEVMGLSDSVGHFDRELTLTAEDKIITLSTCIGGKPDKRFLVQAKLIAVECERDEQ